MGSPATRKASARKRRAARQPAAPEGNQKGDWTTTTLHVPADLAAASMDAAIRRSRRRRPETAKPGRPSVSEIVRDLLYRHRAELEEMISGDGAGALRREFAKKPNGRGGR